ncbi:MAG: M23 family metallopeptidase [Endomicrobium sp.]|jgi:murein DD-endopeptidase MepM/ murein hydrolase activator NlpD|nr:M23 family metallopeptidase [Endomicrobium sp.]
MNENNEIKVINLKNLYLRWSVFVALILGALVTAQIVVAKKAEAMMTSVPVVVLPSYSPETLLNDVDARVKYLVLRVKDVDFFVYSVKPKDNLWTLAKKYGYSVHTLIGVNPQLKTYEININQKIVVPSSGGSLHPIQDGDTWSKISKHYDIDDKVLQLKNFGITNLVPGEYVFIPGKHPAIDLMNKGMQEKYELRSLFRSPLCGCPSSHFGKRKHPVTGKISFHGGVDIAVQSGTWVGAAADGVVIVASRNVGHYGTAVFIDHKNGYITHYGHLSSINVRLGQKVKKGQLIAKSGTTGRVTGPHLHFTIKKGDKALDPMKLIW